MNQREPTSAPKGVGQALPRLTLLLLPLLSGVCASAQPHFILQSALKQQTPYIVALGAPALRFQEPAPAAELAIRPPIPNAPRPAATESSSSNLDPIPRQNQEMASTSPSLPSSSPSASTHETIEEPAVSAPTRTPLPILADEMRPQARAEDFLPFFQIPAGGANDVNVIVPVPRAPATPSSLPLSSATYTQTPR